MDAHAAIDRAARGSYGRLIAFLSARSHDVAAAEDALSDAFRAALDRWPRDGVPDRPEAWLLTAARRRLIDVARHARVRDASVPDLEAIADDAVEHAARDAAFPDHRLALMFVCAHPAIDAKARTALMLQTVLGLDAARIASAFVVRPAAMGQRLARAKARIRDTGLRFEVPGRREWPERLDAVLEAIYAAFGSGWHAIAGGDPKRDGLAAEAIELGRTMRASMPDEPEAAGLLALMLYSDSRKAARRDGGLYVPLSEQDMRLWAHDAIDEADALLRDAERANRLGRFQLEAAIQSMHARRRRTGSTDWDAIAWLYRGLVHLYPTVGARVGHAAAVAEAHGVVAADALLDAMPVASVTSYQPYWALRAHLHRRASRVAASIDAYDRAIGLCDDEAMRRFLYDRRLRAIDGA